jgi:hypothetical protein
MHHTVKSIITFIEKHVLFTYKEDFMPIVNLKSKAIWFVNTAKNLKAIHEIELSEVQRSVLDQIIRQNQKVLDDINACVYCNQLVLFKVLIYESNLTCKEGLIEAIENFEGDLIAMNKRDRTTIENALYAGFKIILDPTIPIEEKYKVVNNLEYNLDDLVPMFSPLGKTLALICIAAIGVAITTAIAGSIVTPIVSTLVAIGSIWAMAEISKPHSDFVCIPMEIY